MAKCLPFHFGHKAPLAFLQTPLLRPLSQHRRQTETPLVRGQAKQQSFYSFGRLTYLQLECRRNRKCKWSDLLRASSEREVAAPERSRTNRCKLISAAAAIA